MKASLALVVTRRRWTSRAVTQAIMLLATYAGSAEGTTMVLFSDEELVEKAPVIVVGQVQRILPATTEAVTEWVIAIERVLKGPLTEDVIVVRSLGGETVTG